MADPFVAEIRIFPFSFAPKGWAFCDGQLLPLSQNTALFSLIGTYYGGDGKSNFALPDLQGRSPLSQGQGPGLSERFLGEQDGSATVTLQQTEMPLHPHGLMAQNFPASDNVPTAKTLARGSGSPALNIYAPPGTLAMMSPAAVAPAGGGMPHNNLMPYLTLNFCIALQGVFPPRQ
jgi:microcystin-dependent protein